MTMITHELIRLPAPRSRMTARRKEAILLSLAAGQSDEATIVALYGLSHDELEEWRGRYAVVGRKGLYASKPLWVKPRVRRKR